MIKVFGAEIIRCPRAIRLSNALVRGPYGAGEWWGTMAPCQPKGPVAPEG
jgi:hypothetical protein